MGESISVFCSIYSHFMPISLSLDYYSFIVSVGIRQCESSNFVLLLKLLSLLFYDHSISFHLLRSSVILSNILQFSVHKFCVYFARFIPVMQARDGPLLPTSGAHTLAPSPAMTCQVVLYDPPHPAERMLSENMLQKTTFGSCSHSRSDHLFWEKQAAM